MSTVRVFGLGMLLLFAIGSHRPADPQAPCFHTVIFGNQLVEVKAEHPLDQWEREWIEEQGRTIALPPGIVRLCVWEEENKEVSNYYTITLELRQTDDTPRLFDKGKSFDRDKAFKIAVENLVRLLPPLPPVSNSRWR